MTGPLYISMHRLCIAVCGPQHKSFVAVPASVKKVSLTVSLSHGLAAPVPRVGRPGTRDETQH